MNDKPWSDKSDLEIRYEALKQANEALEAERDKLKEDLRLMKEIGVDSQRALNARQYKEYLEKLTALEAERDELKRTAFDLLDHRKTMTEMAVQTRDAKIEELKAAHAECLRIIEAQKEYSKWDIDKAISRITALEAQNAELRHEIATAEKYLTSCGYDKAEYYEPEKQMLQSFRQALLKGAKGDGT